MTVFITGVTGYIGSGVARAFLARGDRVIGLTRSSRKAEELSDEGVRPVVGSLSDSALLEQSAARTDVVVHAAVDYEADARALDEAAVAAMLRGLGGGGHLLYTSGTWVFGDTGKGVADERAPRVPIVEVQWRPEVEDRVMARGGIVIRPGVVYGGPGGMTAGWFEAIRTGQPVEVVGDGTNAWPMVHLDDLARAYVAAAEHGRAGRSYNIVDDSRDTWWSYPEPVDTSVKRSVLLKGVKHGTRKTGNPV